MLNRFSRISLSFSDSGSCDRHCDSKTTNDSIQSYAFNGEMRRNGFRCDRIHLVFIRNQREQQLGAVERKIRSRRFLELVEKHLEEIGRPECFKHTKNKERKKEKNSGWISMRWSRTLRVASNPSSWMEESSWRRERLLTSTWGMFLEI